MGDGVEFDLHALEQVGDPLDERLEQAREQRRRRGAGGRRTLDAVTRRRVAGANAATARAEAAAIDAAADTVRALRTTLDIGAEKKEGG